ncbi:hypothetical protein MRX96_041275 [Rhipicephalus microplus]
MCAIKGEVWYESRRANAHAARIYEGRRILSNVSRAGVCHGRGCQERKRNRTIWSREVVPATLSLAPVGSAGLHTCGDGVLPLTAAHRSLWERTVWGSHIACRLDGRLVLVSGAKRLRANGVPALGLARCAHRSCVPSRPGGV